MSGSDIIGIILCLLVAGIFLEFALDVIAEDEDE
jgi:hypothetical protein